MAAKQVAVEGDVTATTGTIPFTGADSGTWTAGLITVQSYPLLTIMKRKVIYQASCTFSFSGKAGNNTPVPGSEQVVLEATATPLMKGAKCVLLQGDTKTGTFGNQLTVACSTAKLTTS